jgi:molybdenum cofactor cytidylyltransferase
VVGSMLPGKRASRVAAIVLAAGTSHRMGRLNKLELPVGGVALLRRTVQTMLASRLAEIVVVLGHGVERTRPLLDGLAVRVVHNRDYRNGHMSSLRLGLEALEEGQDGIMICLADQPLLTAEDIDGLIRAFQQRSRGSIVVPQYRGWRGNPVVLADPHRRSLLAEGRPLDCRRLIDRHPDWVVWIETDNDHVLVDVDTPEDYAAIQARFRSKSGMSF